MNSSLKDKVNKTLSKLKWYTTVVDEQPTLLSLHTIEKSIYISRQYSCE